MLLIIFEALSFWQKPDPAPYASAMPVSVLAYLALTNVKRSSGKKDVDIGFVAV